MITSTTKKQLLVFVIITLVGVSFVGARYAHLDRLFYDSTYTVNAHFAQSGGIFTGAEVTYRGVGDRPGREHEADRRRGRRPALDRQGRGQDPQEDVAAGRQQVRRGRAVRRAAAPDRRRAPTSRTGRRSTPRRHQVPVSTTEILTNLDNLVQSVPQADLRTVVAESGPRSRTPDPSIGQIIDTSQLVHRDRRGQLRDHDGADPQLPRRAADPGRQGLGDPQLRPRPRPVQRHGRRQRQGPALGDRQRLRHGQRAARPSSRRTASTSAS